MQFLIVDDHPITRLGIRGLIEGHWPGHTVVEAETIDAACAACRERQPDAIVADLGLPDAVGTDGIARLMQAAPAAAVLVVSSAPEEMYAARLLRMGVRGFLPKDRTGPELVEALQRVMSGRRYVTASMADRLVDWLGSGQNEKLPHELLSEQEHRVMLMIANGVQPAEIARTMNISAKTVGTYRGRIMEKTGWKSNAEFTRYCIQQGLIDG